MTTSLNLTSIGQIAVRVHDVERAVRFYRDVLDMTLLMQMDNMAFFSVGGVRLMLSLPEPAELDHAASIIYYRVDDIQAAHAALVAKNVPIVALPHLVARMPDHELWMMFFRDPDENLLALMSEQRK